MNTRIRQVLSLAVLVIAGLASLATSQAAPSTTTHVEGRTEVTSTGGTIDGTLTAGGFVADSYYEGTNSITLDFAMLAGGQPRDEGSTEAQILLPDGEVPDHGWSGSITGAKLPLTGCALTADPCSYRFHVALRQVTPSADGVVVVPWSINANAPGTGELKIVLDQTAESPEFSEAAGLPLATGFGVGLIAFLLLALFRKPDLGVAIHEIAALGVFAVSGAFLLATADGAAATDTVGRLYVAIAVVAAGWALLKRRWPRRPGLALVVSLPIAAAFVFGFFYEAGEFRPTDVAISMFALGFGLSASAAGALWLIGRASRGVSRRDPRTWAVSLLALGLIGIFVAVLVYNAVVVGPSSTGTGFLLVICALAMGIGAWRWLLGDSLTPFICGMFLVGLGILAVGGTLVAGVITNIGGSGSAGPDLSPALTVAGVLILSGVIFAIATSMPPTMTDGRGQGKPLQRRWETGEPQLVGRVDMDGSPVA